MGGEFYRSSSLAVRWYTERGSEVLPVMLQSTLNGSFSKIIILNLQSLLARPQCYSKGRHKPALFSQVTCGQRAPGGTQHPDTAQQTVTHCKAKDFDAIFSAVPTHKARLE